MKNLLSVLATFGVVASSAVSVVACGKKIDDKKVSKPKVELTQVIQNFEQDVTKIWTQHYEKEFCNKFNYFRRCKITIMNF
ncbi:lipoprotein [Spiroplasma endosymbiont of Atherix ibis]|uniref:lipoprotein n=1 Tax=Spiroplasma endosymbiont of Atherix ibis TaxID=3066291 RepID=UPI0030D5EB48